MSCKREGLLITPRHEKGLPFRSHNTLRQRSYDIERTAFPPISYSPTLTNPQSTCEIYGLRLFKVRARCGVGDLIASMLARECRREIPRKMTMAPGFPGAIVIQVGVK